MSPVKFASFRTLALASNWNVSTEPQNKTLPQSIWGIGSSGVSTPPGTRDHIAPAATPPISSLPLHHPSLSGCSQSSPTGLHRSWMEWAGVEDCSGGGFMRIQAAYWICSQPGLCSHLLMPAVASHSAHRTSHFGVPRLQYQGPLASLPHPQPAPWDATDWIPIHICQIISLKPFFMVALITWKSAPRN